MTKEEALERLRYKCSRAEYCSGQIVGTLQRWILGQTQLCKEDIPDIMSALVAENFIDDSRFANAFVRDKLKFNGWGKQKIIYKLKSLGIARDVIEQALALNYEVEREGELNGYQVLEKLLVKKWESLKKEESRQIRKAKVIRFALGRGFEYNDILRILENMHFNT